MAFSGGTFSRLYDWTTDRDNGVKILASRMDQEFDGMATGLSTCILKDGTQTCTAAIPFAQGITLPDNKTIILGTNSDITIQYDESTNDSLEIAANVEGAALGIVLKADQGDDNADQHKVGIADGGTLTMASKISGSFVSYLTHTPNSTVASSTTAVAGNLTVGGDLTLGSGAVISEAELETIDGITPGTAAASKAMVLDASLDISGGRNLTISGELDAATLDVSGDVDIDGTLETDALSIASTAVTATAAELNYSDTGAAVGTVVASKVVTADANKDVASFRNITLTGELDAGSLDISGDADIDGTLEADAMTLNGTAITATATLDTGISNNNVPKFTSGVADDDFLRVDGTAIEGRSAAEVLSDIAAAPAAGSSNIVTTGALNSGSITSGFGSIDNGASAITTTGVITGGTLEATADTSAGDNAAIGYTSAEGLILTGQGSTSDITLKNDADATVFTVPTGQDDILFPDGAKCMFGASSDLQISHNGSYSLIADSGTGNLILACQDFSLTNPAIGENMITAAVDGAVTLFHDNAAKVATTANGCTITGDIANASGNMTIDIAGDLNLDADGGNVLFKDGGTEIGRLSNSASNLDIRSSVSNKDMFFTVSGSERLRVNASGNVGIGLSSGIDGKLHVAGNTVVGDSSTTAFSSFTSGGLDVAVGSGTKAFQVWDDNSTSTPRFIVERGGKVGIGTASPTLDGSLAGLSVSSSGTVLHVNDGNGASLKLTDPATGANRGFGITLQGTEAAISNCESGALRFGTGNTERGRFDASGNFLISTTSDAPRNFSSSAYGIKLVGSQPEFAVDTAYFNKSNGTGTLINFRESGNDRGTISVSGSAVAYNTSSDRRLKSNIEDAASASDKIDAIQVRQFDWNVDDSHQDYGLIAQELQPIEPLAVTGSADSDEMMGVDYSKLVPMLIKEIQELRSRVATLEAN